MITLQEIRKEFPRGKYQEDTLWLKYFVRPISFYVAAIFVNIGCSANQISFLAMGILSASFLFFSMANYTMNFTGAVFLNLYMVFDCVDGNIARVMKTQSRYGEFLEAVNGYYVNGLCFLLIGWAAMHTSTPYIFNIELNYILLGAVTCICNLLVRTINLKAMMVFSACDRFVDNNVRIGFAKRIDKEIGITGLLLPFILVCGAINQLRIFVIFYFVYYLLSAVFYFIAMLLKYSKNS